MSILVLDNYDSFTYNLVEYLHKTTLESITVKRNDEIKLAEVNFFDKIILSPGPGLPKDAGILKPLIRQYAPTKQILGICLGHQAIAEVFGASLEQSPTMYHGVSSLLEKTSTKSKIFTNISNPFEAGRYHSWQVKKDSIPNCLQPTCLDKDGVVMGFVHTEYQLEGLQFHPESVLTPKGLQMLKNWIKQK